MRHDTRQRPGAQTCRGGSAQQHQRGRTVVDGRTGCGGDGAVLFEGGFQQRYLVEFYLAWTFVDGNHHLARATLDGDRRDLGGKSAGLGGRLRALHAGHGEFVLRAAREVVFGRAVFTKGAHGAAGLVGIFQAVQHHVVEDAVVPDADAAAALGQQVRRIGHAFHAAGDHHLVAAGQQHIARHHGRLHARAAHLGQGHGAGAFGQTALERGLARGSLALAGHQAVAKQHFGHQFRRHAGARHGGLDGRATQVVGGQRAEVALEATHGGTGGTGDNNRVSNGIRHGFSLRSG